MTTRLETTAALAFALAASGGAFAQQATTSATSASPTQSARSLIAQFERTTGARVQTTGNLNLDRLVPVPAGLMGSRSRLMENIAGAVDASWRKTWIVTAAGPGKSVADAAYLRTVIDTAGTAGFDVTNVPAAQAIATAARADGADVQIVGTIPDSLVTIHDPDMSVADAIAAVSQQTSTNWSLTYRLSPQVDTQSAPVRLFHRNTYEQFQWEQSRINSPIRVHFQYPSTGPDPAIYESLWGTNSVPQVVITPPSVMTPASQLGVIGSSGYNSAYGYPYGSTTYLGTSSLGLNAYPIGTTTTTGVTTATVGNQAATTATTGSTTNVIGNQSGVTTTTNPTTIGNQPTTTTGN